jgi:hypothetical protein
MAGVLVISLIFLFYLGRYLIENSGEWQDFILHGPAASAPADPAAEGDDVPAPAPSPDDATK